MMDINVGKGKTRRVVECWHARAFVTEHVMEVCLGLYMLIGFRSKRVSPPPIILRRLFSFHRATMPRKVAAASEGATDNTEPRRSSRIKDLPKPEPVVKKPAKPRAKKAEKDKEDKPVDKEEKPKSRGRKRKEADEPNGAPAVEGEGEAEEPPAKKVCFWVIP
jgi:hypothetical protein